MVNMKVTAPRARIAAVLVGVGVAASVHAQTDTSLLKFQVRPQGAPASAWTSDLHVLPGTIVEFRALVTFQGTSPAVGLSVAQFQPTVSNWSSTTDALQPFRAVGTGTYVSSWTPQAGSVLRDSGQYGRVYPYGGSGISTINALRGHTNNVVNGTRYLRIALANSTNWAGVGPTAGSAAANNTNGAGGLAIGEVAPMVAGSPAANFVQETVDVEVARFAITVGGTAQRDMEVSAPAQSISYTASTGNMRVFRWFRTLQSDASDLVDTPVTIQSAMIHVPAPSGLSLLGLGAIVARRRR